MTINEFKLKVKGTKISPQIKEVCVQVGVFLLALLVTPQKFVFSTYPFGLALVAGIKGYTPFALVGAVASVLFFMGGDVSYIIALLGICGLRLVASFIKRSEDVPLLLGEKKRSPLESVFNESVFLRVAIGILGAFGIGLYRVISNGYSYYDVFVLVFFSVVTGLFAYTLSPILQRGIRGKDFMLTLGALGFILVYFLSGKELFGIDFAIVITFATVLYVSKYISGAKAGAIGIVLGLATGIAFAPVYGIAGVVSSLLWPLSPFLSVMSAFVVGMGYGILANGYEAIVYLAPELLFVTLVMYPLIRFELIPKPSFLKKEQRENKSPITVIAEEKARGLSKSLGDAGASFLEVSRQLRDISKKIKTPDRARYRSTCVELVESYCFSCPKNEICWKNDSKTTEANIFRLADSAFSRGVCKKTDVDERFLHRCPYVEKIIEEMNRKTKRELKQQIKNDRLDISAMDYELLARLLEGISKEAEAEERLDGALGDKIMRIMCKNGVVLEGAEITSDVPRQIILTGIDIARTSCSESKIKEILENELDLRLGEPRLEINGSYGAITLSAVPKRSVECYFVEGDGKEISGDVCSSFSGANGCEYMLLCDGMGSGAEARLTAKMCVDFLEKILKVTREKELALSMLNNLVRAKNIECSSAIDLLEINLGSLEGSFVKSGSAPSFVIRDGKAHRLQSKTAPVGIMKELDAEKLSFNLRVGDICVMVSDGILPAKGSEDWLLALLEGELPKPDEIPDLIVREAKKRNVSRDDMSVLVCRVA